MRMRLGAGFAIAVTPIVDDIRTSLTVWLLGFAVGKRVERWSALLIGCLHAKRLSARRFRGLVDRRQRAALSTSVRFGGLSYFYTSAIYGESDQTVSLWSYLVRRAHVNSTRDGARFWQKGNVHFCQRRGNWCMKRG